MKKLFAVLWLCVATLVFAACGGQEGGEVTPSPASGVNRPASTTTTPPPANPQLGQTYTYENGLAVTVGQPQPYTPSSSAAGADPALPALLFPITIVNGSTENYETSSFSTTLQSGNQEASKIYDTANNVGSAPSTPTLPGREAAFQIAYAVTNPADLVMQVRPEFDYTAIIFTS
jgi:hypothetical protein